MSKKILRFAIAVIITAMSAPIAIADEANINSGAHISALIHCEREKRAKKFLWLVPGKIRFYHYEWVMPSGATVVKVESTKFPGVYDRRPLKESHPNLAILIPTVQTAAQIGMNATTTLK